MLHIQNSCLHTASSRHPHCGWYIAHIWFLAPLLLMDENLLISPRFSSKLANRHTVCPIRICQHPHFQTLIYRFGAHYGWYLAPTRGGGLLIDDKFRPKAFYFLVTMHKWMKIRSPKANLLFMWLYIHGWKLEALWQICFSCDYA